MQYFVPAQVTISAINASGWDQDLIVPIGKYITIPDTAGVSRQIQSVMMTLGGSE